MPPAGGEVRASGAIHAGSRRSSGRKRQLMRVDRQGSLKFCRSADLFSAQELLAAKSAFEVFDGFALSNEVAEDLA